MNTDNFSARSRRFELKLLVLIAGAIAAACGETPAGNALLEAEEPAQPADEPQGVTTPSIEVEAGTAAEPPLTGAVPDAGDAAPAVPKPTKIFLDCKGYTEILGPATNSVRHAYSANLESTCETVRAMCATGVTDTRKILCAAIAFNGVFYGNAYSTTYGGANAIPLYGFNAPSNANYGLQPNAWLAARAPGLNAQNLLDSSGLTAVALARAYQFEDANLYCSGQFTANRLPALFEQLPASSIRAGDFLTKTFGCNATAVGHIVIAASTPDANGNLVAYETNGWGKPVRFTERNLSDFAGGWSRFKPQ